MWKIRGSPLSIKHPHPQHSQSTISSSLFKTVAAFSNPWLPPPLRTPPTPDRRKSSQNRNLILQIPVIVATLLVSGLQRPKIILEKSLGFALIQRITQKLNANSGNGLMKKIQSTRRKEMKWEHNPVKLGHNLVK
ncbi:unnamed protein product [Lactuca saligna]|uniref:Uncharacterized protein n=1 Tax=Lactuca saligna TaxID=75948 RepID=A0AA35ZFZ4_LACSI|nr:unnamed protein product [Lactuca saligna]